MRRTSQVADLICPTCSENLSKPSVAVGAQGWEQGPIAHCDGQSKAFNSKLQGVPHHHHVRYLPCIECGADMGCPRCSGHMSELLCMALGAADAHWGSHEAYEEHGRLLASPEERREALDFLRSAVGMARAQETTTTEGSHADRTPEME